MSSDYMSDIAPLSYNTVEPLYDDHLSHDPSTLPAVNSGERLGPPPNNPRCCTKNRPLLEVVATLVGGAKETFWNNKQ